MTEKALRRIKIKKSIRSKVSGTSSKPRMTVFRSNKQIYVQVINDETGTTLASASSLKMTEKCAKKEQAAKVGRGVADIRRRDAGSVVNGYAKSCLCSKLLR